MLAIEMFKTISQKGLPELFADNDNNQAQRMRLTCISVGETLVFRYHVLQQRRLRGKGCGSCYEPAVICKRISSCQNGDYVGRFVSH